MKFRLTVSEFYTLGVAVFLLDHAGLYFFTDNLWTRVLRLFAPAWFFPCGYNAGWKSHWRVWTGMGVLLACDVLTGAPALPLSALATIVSTRLAIVPLMEVAMKGRLPFISVTLVLSALLPLAAPLTEYGTFGLLFAMLGWLVRHRGLYDAKTVNAKYFAAYITLLYLGFTQWTLGFSAPQFIVAAIPVVLIMLPLWHFRALVTEELKRPRGWWPRASHWIAHHSLAIYVTHLVAFRLIYVYMLKA